MSHTPAQFYPSIYPPLSSCPSPMFFDEETRKVALERTAGVLRTLNDLRRELDLPPESFKDLLEVYASAAREVALEKQRAADEARLSRQPLTMQSTDLARKPLRLKLGEKVQVIARPQFCAYRVEEIEIDGDPTQWVVHDILVGNRSQGQQQFLHPIPGERFRKGGIMSELRLETCQTAMDFVLVVEYVGSSGEGAVFEATCVAASARVASAVRDEQIDPSASVLN